MRDGPICMNPVHLFPYHFFFFEMFKKSLGDISFAFSGSDLIIGVIDSKQQDYDTGSEEAISYCYTSKRIFDIENKLK